MEKKIAGVFLLTRTQRNRTVGPAAGPPVGNPEISVLM